METQIIYSDEGHLDYNNALELQAEKRARIIFLKSRKIETSKENRLILCEHDPILTFGSSAKDTDLYVDRERLTELGLDMVQVRRGGAITFHGPGQLVGYPILDLENFRTDVRWYIRTLAKVIIDTLHSYGITGYYDADHPGVWIYDDKTDKKKKICAVGVHLSRWTTNHGFSLNVSNEMKYYDYFVPCSIREPNRTVTTLSQELDRKISTTEVKDVLLTNFERHFQTEIVRADMVKQ